MLLTGEEGERPYRQTVSRIMRLINELGEEYLDLRKVDG